MSDNRTEAWAEALLLIARAEGQTERVTDELFALGEAVAADDQLRATLADPRLPVERRAQVVEDLLESKASEVTIALASAIVAAGRGDELATLATAVARRGAESAGASLAEVRSAIPLTDEQIEALTRALTAKLGREVTVRNVVDPSVVGGVVTQIGDQVIDGSVRTRLHQLREAF